MIKSLSYLLLLTQSRNHVKIMFPTKLRDRQELFGAEFIATNGIKLFFLLKSLSSTLRKSSGEAVRQFFSVIVPNYNLSIGFK